jgi:hypothetical protein
VESKSADQLIAPVSPVSRRCFVFVDVRRERTLAVGKKEKKGKEKVFFFGVRKIFFSAQEVRRRLRAGAGIARAFSVFDLGCELKNSEISSF